MMSTPGSLLLARNAASWLLRDFLSLQFTAGGDDLGFLMTELEEEKNASDLLLNCPEGWALVS